MTRNQRLRAIDEHERQYGPDASKVLHVFPDGWSVRQPRTYNDIHREGILNRNCWRFDDSDLDDPVDVIGPEGLQTPIGYPNYHSLRDPDNHPQVSFYHASPRAGEDIGYTNDALGHGNSPVTPENGQRIDQWHDALPYDISWKDRDHTVGNDTPCPYCNFPTQWSGETPCPNCGNFVHAPAAEVPRA